MVDSKENDKFDLGVKGLSLVTHYLALQKFSVVQLVFLKYVLLVRLVLV